MIDCAIFETVQDGSLVINKEATTNLGTLKAILDFLLMRRACRLRAAAPATSTMAASSLSSDCRSGEARGAAAGGAGEEAGGRLLPAVTLPERHASMELRSERSASVVPAHSARQHTA
ncbi:hypothetical protein JYU34_009641 [Plutella xylostella]|uniref:Uncharacterized protein n=1 Tax=Plutella xylostella TaxID=51655 RepID=A0ABQ7QK71_PLUXY|nr:hypothetical protein JYU34_009641 [Plutella xylostella]